LLHVYNQVLTYPADAPVPDQFDIISTTFCLEYATETDEQFATALRNSLRLLKPGGYLLQV
jgi:SAM-dependent methyltransferase